MKLKVAFKLLVAFFCVHLTASAPLRLLRIRNMTFLFVETPDGERVQILYAPSGKGLGSFPIGQYPIEPKNDEPTTKGGHAASKSDDSTVLDDDLASDDDEEPFDPELDAPRVDSSVIQAPKFKSPCDRGHRVDRHGNCRRIW